MIKKEFEKWYLSRFDGDIFWSLKDDCYIPIKAHYMWLAWQEVIDRKQQVIDAMADKVDELIEENARLKEAHENTVKMLREVLRMLDLKLHL